MNQGFRLLSLNLRGVLDFCLHMLAAILRVSATLLTFSSCSPLLWIFFVFGFAFYLDWESFFSSPLEDFFMEVSMIWFYFLDSSSSGFSSIVTLPSLMLTSEVLQWSKSKESSVYFDSSPYSYNYFGSVDEHKCEAGV